MNRAAFYATARSKLGRLSQKQVDGFEIILAASEGLPRSHRAYLLATAWHETGATMQPIMERGNGDGPDADPWDDYLERYDTGKLAKVLGNTPEADGDGVRYAGRGYVQLTGLTNYKRASVLTGLDLVNNPTLAKQPTVAAKILVEGFKSGMFTGKKLSDYLPGDYLGARKIINGTDKAQLIASYAEIFDRALQAAGVSDTPRKTATEPRVRDVAFTVPGQADTPPAAKKPGSAAKPAATVSLIGIALAALAYWWAEVTQRVADFFNAMFGG